MPTWSSCVRTVAAALVGCGPWVLPVEAQPVGEPLVNVDADPIRCWWHADRGAMRVGETLAVVLTCAVVETDAARVVVDRSRLDPAVVVLSPFDVTGGSQAADTVSGARRFFQYTYLLRVINENAIGRDLLVPELAISYRIESRTGEGGALDGRDRTYHMPPLPLRVVSLVASDAGDIREAAAGTFESIEAREFRGRLLRLAAVVSYALAALLALVATRRAFAGRRRASDVPVRISDRAVINGAFAALAGARAALGRDAGDEPAAGRALDALRVLAAYAVGETATQTPVEHARDTGGQLRVRGGWLRAHTAMVSAPTSAGSVLRHIEALPAEAEDRRLKLEALADALARLTTARYGARPALDQAALDAALDTVSSLASDLAREHLWLERRRRAAARALGQLGQLGARAWTR